jgi:centromeric protein E
MIKLVEEGEEARIIAATNLNEQSSRSHTVFQINIETKEKKANGEISIRTSQFNLVDLAGSEGVSRTKSEGIRFREGSNINKSLLALSKVIHRLSSCSNNKSKVFINYRDSKLTRILQPSLGGNSQTVIICTLSQLFVNYQESVNTLLFGQMAKNVKSVVNINEVVKNKEVMELKAAKQENEELRDKIMQLEAKLKDI